MTPKMTNLMKSIKKVKKPVFRMFLVGTYGVAQKAKELSDYRSGIQDGTDLQADLRTGDLDDEEDLDEDEKGPEAEPAKEKSLECRGSQGGLGPRAQRPETELIHKSKHILHAQCHLVNKEETAAPIPEGGKRGGDDSYGKHVPHDGGERDQGGESGEHRNNFKNVSTPVSNELVVKRNEQSKRHFSEERR